LGDEKLSHDFSPALRLFAPARDECSEALKDRMPEEGEKFAVLMPGSEWETKRWSWEGYREVAKALIDRKMKVLVCGNSKERAYNKQVSENLDVIDLSGQTTLQDLMYLIKNAALVVCNDSMALHMASAFKTPNVAIFCATSPEFGFGPWMNSASVVVQKEGLYCKPCRRHGGHICPTGTEKCMKDLPASDVIRAIDNILSI
ncbi:MAG: glycosyltransferase family 9 protein, partial [SAR324 cluster bacterium]|nr:glycosyltransferase family 9 protein [SAR324 cluster bacterium]